jgi:hypothetical protein
VEERLGIETRVPDTPNKAALPVTIPQADKLEELPANKIANKQAVL